MTWRAIRCPPGLEPGTRAYQREVRDGHLTLFVSPPNPGINDWHLSISHRSSSLVGANGLPLAGRYPTWDEIRDARYEFVPDAVTMAMLLPPKAEYVNLQSTTFHLHQIQGE